MIVLQQLKQQDQPALIEQREGICINDPVTQTEKD